jgi:hypothetical protein
VSSFGIPAAVLSRARHVADDIGARVAQLGGRSIDVDADEIITGRAALLGLGVPGALSAGGASRLIATADGWCAVTLSRADDVDAVPALLELDDVGDDPWPSLGSAAVERPAAELVARARLLGIPAAVLGETAAAHPNVLPHNETAMHTLTDLLVVDLSSMWAGPLCGRLLAASGATVVKVESPSRPDGTRAGHRGFFDWMNGEKLCYSVDFDSDELRELLRAADAVIEGSRPAALARRGLAADQLPARAGRVWLRITGYGSDHPDRIAFGDDAAVAGGLVGYHDGRPVFCGDAIADPLSGLEATLALLDALTRGGGVIVDVSMAAVAANYAALPTEPVDGPPRIPTPAGQPAHELGADNARVEELVAARRVAC